MSDTRAQHLRQSLERIDGKAPGSGLGKHRKMASSPFVFFRGSAQMFYQDLSTGRLSLPEPLMALPLTAIMGDCHTSNFGFLTEEGSHGDTVIFSPNDFDDACIGHGPWDLLRYLVSLVLCAQHCQALVSGQIASEDEVVGKSVVNAKDVSEAMDSFINGYLSVCELGLHSANHFDNVLAFPDKTSALFKPYKKARSRAAGGDQFLLKSQLAKSVELSGEQVRFKQRPDKFEGLDAKLETALIDVFSPYMDDCVHQVVRRLNAGTGSVNMDRYYFLVGPERLAGQQHLTLCHIVEVKQQREAAPLYYFSDLSPINRLNPAHLTVACQRRMQRRPDLVLDEVVWRKQHWLVRSRHHAKVGFDPEDIGIGKRNVEKRGFIEYAQVCGQALALAHCRADRRSNFFEQSVIDVLPTHLDGLKNIARSYADQVIADAAWLASLES